MNGMNAERSLIKGLLAGLVAGLIATAAKTIAARLYAPSLNKDAERPDVLGEDFAPYTTETQASAKVSTAIDWGFGAAAGAAYGALVEFYPAAASGEGKTFGLALMTLTHETALPAAGMPYDMDDQPDREQASDAASHLVFGTVAEQVRSYVRGMLE